MYKWFFVVYFLCVAASDEKLYIFDREETILAECIVQQLVNINDTFKMSRVANETARLAAKRLHGKSMSTDSFSRRFGKFYYDLRIGRLNHDFDNDELSEQLQVALKQALIVCADNPTVKKEKSEQVSIQSEEWISFSQHELSFSICIENHLKLSGRREFVLENGFTEFIAISAARRYHGRYLTKNDFLQKYKYFFRDLRTKRILHNFDISKLSREVQSTVRQAMEDCAVNKHPLVAIPTFRNEPSGIAQILNLILVKWPNDLYHMIQSRSDRAILRRYANDALTVLMTELNVFQNNTRMFRLTLQSFWNNRAREIYDATSIELPYIEHSCTSNYPTPHMVQSDFEKFVNRSSIDFEKRNPKVSQSYLYEILYIHRSGRTHSNYDIDIYDNYNKYGMTSSDYFFENHLNQFYRIIFFFFELQVRGICANEHDIFNEALPNDLIPEPVQAIVYDNDVYRDYLLKKRLFYEKFLDNDITLNDIAQNLFKNARVMEENLILLMSNDPTTNGIQLRSVGATTRSVSTTSRTTQLSKRKDDVWKNKNGKCFSKRAKKTEIPNGTSINENLDMENLDEGTRSNVQESSNYFVSDFTEEDFSMCFFDEFGAALKRENNETDNFYACVYKNNDI